MSGNSHPVYGSFKNLQDLAATFWRLPKSLVSWSFNWLVFVPYNNIHYDIMNYPVWSKWKSTRNMTLHGARNVSLSSSGNRICIGVQWLLRSRDLQLWINIVYNIVSCIIQRPCCVSSTDVVLVSCGFALSMNYNLNVALLGQSLHKNPTRDATQTDG